MNTSLDRENDRGLLGINFKAIREYVTILWIVISTPAMFYFAYSSYYSSKELNALQAREKLDDFMREVRLHYEKYCERKTQSLVDLWDAHYGSLLRLAEVNEEAVPFNKPCITIAPPMPPTNIWVTLDAGIRIVTYSNWDEFVKATEKKASLLIGNEPVIIDVTNYDWRNTVAAVHERNLQALQNCNQMYAEDPKYRYLDIECSLAIGHDNSTILIAKEIVREKRYERILATKPLQ